MGKKGSWFSAIKRVFTHNSKEKLNESEKNSTKEKKKKGLGKLRHGESNSFIPIFRQPSSIEKILGDAEREHHKIIFRPPTPPEQPRTPTFVPPPRAASPRVASPRAASPRATSPRAASPRVVNQRHKEISYRPEPTLRNQHASATKIQTAYRGYMARRSFRALRGLVRLQGVVRGNNVKRQTMTAMKQMQLLVRVQSQIQSRRIQMLENQALLRQSQYKNDKEVEGSTLGKWTLSQAASEAGNPEDWDDSVLTKEQLDAKMQRKVDAIIKRERAMAYAYSHQLWKGTPKSAQTGLMDIRSGAFPWWWNWLERQLPPSNPPESQTVIKNAHLLTPPRSILEQKPSPSSRPQSSNYKQQQQHSFEFDAIDALTPKSSKSAFAPRLKQAYTPTRLHAQAHSGGGGSSLTTKYSKPRPSGGADSDSAFDVPLKDDDSLMSCPPFSVPNYMNPTVSAKAKARANSNPKERFQSQSNTPRSSDSKRRLSFPLTQGRIGSFKWNKGSLFSSKDTSSQRMMFASKDHSVQSVGNLSVDSTVSMPAGIGRKPFNRFV